MGCNRIYLKPRVERYIMTNKYQSINRGLNKIKQLRIWLALSHIWSMWSHPLCSKKRKTVASAPTARWNGKKRAQFFSHTQGTWAKSPDHGKVIPWPTGRLKDMSLCLSACTNCRFLELHLWCKIAPVFNYMQHTYEEGAQRLHDQGIGGVSTWLKLVTHTLHLVIHLLGIIGIFAWVYSSPLLRPFSQLGGSIGWFELFRKISRWFDWH